MIEIAIGVMITVTCIATLLSILATLHATRISKRIGHANILISRLQNDIHALCVGSIKMGDHISSLEQRLHRLVERQDQVELRDSVQQSYAHAIRMAQQGADIKDLMERCGLARGEADLLLRVHRAPHLRTVTS